jgi:hypothetical protein
MASDRLGDRGRKEIVVVVVETAPELIAERSGHG